MLKKHGFVIMISAFGLALLGSGPALADGDFDAGEKVFNKCKTCHVLTGGAKKMGPTMECIYGRKAGAVAGYRYSKAMESSDIIWTNETMAEFFKNPRKYFKGTKMAFSGLRNEQQMADLLAFLEEATVGEACPK